MNRKRVLSCCLSLLMLVGLFPALTPSAQAQVVDGWAALTDALEAGLPEIILSHAIAGNEELTVRANTTIDLNSQGLTINSSANGIIVQPGVTLTITDRTTFANGRLNITASPATGRGILIAGAGLNLQVRNGTIGISGQSGIYGAGGALQIDGGTISLSGQGTNFGIHTGTLRAQNAQVTFASLNGLNVTPHEHTFRNSTVTGLGAGRFEGTYNAAGRFTVTVTQLTASPPEGEQTTPFNLQLTARVTVSRSNITDPPPLGGVEFRNGGVPIGTAALTSPSAPAGGTITAEAVFDWPVTAPGDFRLSAVFAPLGNDDRYDCAGAEPELRYTARGALNPWPNHPNLTFTARFGQTLGELDLSRFADDTRGTFSWAAPLDTPVGNAGTQMHTLAFVPNNTDLFVPETRDVTVIVSRVDPDRTHITYTPSGLQVFFNGEEQPVSVVPAPGVEGLGAITVFYQQQGSADPPSTTPPTAVGIYNVTVNIAQGQNFNAAQNIAIGALRIVPSAPGSGIFSLTPAHMVYNGAPRIPTLVYTVEGLGEYTLLFNGSAAPPVNAGVYIVSAFFAEGLNYGATEEEVIVGSFTVDRANPTSDDLEYLLTDYVYDGTAKPATVAAAHSVVGLGEVTVLYQRQGSNEPPATTPPVNAGTYAVTVNIAQGLNYNAVEGLPLGTMVIHRADPDTSVLAFGLLSATFDGTSHPVEVGPNEGFTGLGEITVRYNGQTAAPINAGDYTVTVDITAGPNFNAATDIELGTFTINRAAPTASLLYAPFTAVIYDGTVKDDVRVVPRPHVHGMGEITAIWYEKNGRIVPPINAGEYQVRVDIAEGDNFLPAKDLLVGVFVIHRADSIASLFEVDLAAATFDGTAKSVTVEPRADVAGLGDILAVRYNGVTARPVDAGEYVITVDIAAGDNFNAASGVRLGTFIINRAEPTETVLAFGLGAVPFNGAPRPVSVTPNTGVTGLGNITVRYNGQTEPPVNAGEYMVTVDIAAGTNFNAATGIQLGTFTINRADSGADVLAVASRAATFNGAPHSAGITPGPGVTGLGNITVRYNGQAALPVGAGVYTITVDISGGDNVNAMTNVPLGTFTVLRRPIAVPSARRLTWNGNTQTGVPAGTGYTVRNNTARNVGTRNATVTPDSNHQWRSGANPTAARTVSFTIRPAGRTARITTAAVPANRTVRRGTRITLRAPRNTRLFFTTNGSRPTVTTRTRTRVGGRVRIRINRTTTVRVIALRTGHTASREVRRTYRVA